LPNSGATFTTDMSAVTVLQSLCCGDLNRIVFFVGVLPITSGPLQKCRGHLLVATNLKPPTKTRISRQLFTLLALPYDATLAGRRSAATTYADNVPLPAFAHSTSRCCAPCSNQSKVCCFGLCWDRQTDRRTDTVAFPIVSVIRILCEQCQLLFSRKGSGVL